MRTRPVLLHYHSLRAHPRHFFLDCREKHVDVPRLEPLGVDGAVEFVLFPALASLLVGSLGRFEDANAPDADLAVGIVARVRPRVWHNDHDLREMTLVLYAGRPGDSLTREDMILLFLPQKKKTAFVQVDDVSLVKKVAGCLVHLMADEVDPGLFLVLGKIRFDALSNICSLFFYETTALRSRSRSRARYP